MSLLSTVDSDVSRGTCFGELVPDKTSWAVKDVHITPEIALDEFVGVRVGKEQLHGGNVRRGAVFGQVSYTGARCWGCNRTMTYFNPC